MQISALIDGAFATVQAAITAAGKLEGASPRVLAPVRFALRKALEAFDAQQAILEAQIDETTPCGVLGGIPEPTVIAAVGAQLAAVQQLASLRNARGYLSRIYANLNAEPG